MDTRAIEAATAHRPWRLPSLPWILAQSWRNLLFAHWRLPPELLRPLVPAPLQLDLYEGEAWVGITSFEIREFRVRGLPPLPGLAAFPELNLRTYVRAGGRFGVHFFSLDAGSRLAAAGARIAFRLPYRAATMSLRRSGTEIRFRSERDGVARFRAVYAPTDAPWEAAAGSLEHFLTERYALFTVLRSGRVLRADIHHRPWPLQRARATLRPEQLAAAEGVPVPAGPPLLHFAHRQDTLIWAPTVES